MRFIFKWLKAIARINYIALKRFYLEDYTYQASALAFITLLSCVPIISIIIYFFSFFTLFTDFILLAEDYIYTNFIPTTEIPLRTYFDQFIHQAHQLPTLSILFSIMTGIMMILTIEKAMNTIWYTHETRRNFLTTIVSWSILLFMYLFIGFIAFLSISIASLS